MATSYLLWANIIVWVGICGYIFFLGISQQRLSTRMKQLESLIHEQKNK